MNTTSNTIFWYADSNISSRKSNSNEVSTMVGCEQSNQNHNEIQFIKLK